MQASELAVELTANTSVKNPLEKHFEKGNGYKDKDQVYLIIEINRYDHTPAASAMLSLQVGPTVGSEFGLTQRSHTEEAQGISRGHNKKHVQKS